MLSFQNNAVLKQQMLERLEAVKENPEAWNPAVVSWADQKGSVIGHSLHSDDLSQWEDLGLPKWLAMMVDYFYVTAAQVSQGVETGIGLINSVPVGVNLAQTGSRIVLALCQDPALGILQRELHDTAAQAVALVIDAHQKILNGVEIKPAEWRQLRKQVLALTDQCDEESPEQLVCIFAEACAWDPILSRTAVSDSIRTWVRAVGAFEQAPDWTKEQDTHVRALLQEQYNLAKAKQPEGSQEFIDVFKLLEVSHPEDSLWLRRQIRWGHEQPQRSTEQVLALIQTLF